MIFAHEIFLHVDLKDEHNAWILYYIAMCVKTLRDFFFKIHELADNYSAIEKNHDSFFH